MPTTPNLKITGEEIQEALKDLDLTQQQFADLIGATGLSVSRWVTGVHPPRLPGAIWMALEYLKIQRVMDDHQLLSALDERRAKIDDMHARILREREEFEQRLNKKPASK